MDRHFLSFPNGSHGTGLFLLRITLACGLATEAVAGIRDPANPVFVLLAVGAMVAGALVLVGLWTIVAALLMSILQLSILFIIHRGIELHLMRAAVGLCLVFLGPGAWSVDARLFGRRRVEIQDLRDN